MLRLRFEIKVLKVNGSGSHRKGDMLLSSSLLSHYLKRAKKSVEELLP
ncbi:MAG: hypothetical protein ACTS73_02040 [Arsenophonus sp. NEOnobi-MAG3]